MLPPFFLTILNLSKIEQPTAFSLRFVLYALCLPFSENDGNSIARSVLLVSKNFRKQNPLTDNFPYKQNCVTYSVFAEICAAHIILGQIVSMYTKGAQQLNPANAMCKQIT